MKGPAGRSGSAGRRCRAAFRRASLIVPSLLAAGLGGSAGVRAQGPSAIPAAEEPGTAQAQPTVTLLIDQANFWLSQSNPNAALQAATRALQVEPLNVEALFAARDAAMLLARPEAAEYLSRLRRLAPNDPRLRQAEVASREPATDPAILAQARELAQAGRTVEAVQRYRQAFQGTEPPAARAVEYYQVLAGASEAGYQEARTRLEELARRLPSDSHLQLTYAQLLTYREESRIEGIERLQRLAQVPSTASAARAAWRQALLYLGEDPGTVELVNTYLLTNPTDPQIEMKRTQAQATMISPGGEARILGWGALQSNRAEAERQFRISIDLDPRDAEAIVGMAVIRQAQGRLPEARRLLDQALEISPDRREDFLRIMGTGPGTVSGGPGSGGIAFSNATASWQALNRGNLDRADALARKAIRTRGNERLQGEIVLGQIAMRREDFPTAETRFRAALALRPKLPAALAGLYDALLRQGRFAEADALQQETGLNPATAAASRAYAMREQAFRETDPARQMALLREALAVDPANPWLKVDLARLLRDAGQRAEAGQIGQQLAQDTSAEGSAAAALLASEDDRPGDVIPLLERVPVRLRSPDMNRLLARSRQEVDILALEQQVRAGQPEARQRLLALADSRDPSGAIGAAVVRAFGRLGDGAAAVAAARGALAANPSQGSELRLAIAGGLAGAGQEAEAAALIAPLANDPSLKPEERRQVASLQASVVATQADRLNEAGDRIAAFQLLTPVMQRQPGNPQLNAALARVYLANGQPNEARAVAERVLAQDSRNLDARTTLIDIAISQGAFSRAEGLVAEGKALHPDEVSLSLVEARLARARGDALRAQRLLENAVRRRMAELQAVGASGQTTLTADLLSPRRAAARVGQEPADRLSAELVQALIQAREETSVWLQAGTGTRWHSGARGLGRLNEITAPVELSAPVAGIGGRLYAQAGTVSLNSGSFAGGSASAYQFGTAPLIGAGTPQGRAGHWVNGVSVGLGYASRTVRVDLGTTPLGFQQSNVTGGVEVALRLTPTLQLRAVGERRAVTESLLSYAGQRDPGTGRSWGGVTRTGVRAQLEYAATDRLNLYGGGGWAAVLGDNVARNAMVEVGGGFAFAALRSPEQDVTIGPDLRYIHFDRNLGNFTFGQGGYFSPQSHVIASLQGEWRRQWGDLTARVRGSIGWQRFHQHASATFPNDPGLQSQLQLEQAANPSVVASYPSQSQSGVTGGIRANLEYALSPKLRLGAIGRFNHSGDYTDAAGLIYLRWRLDQPPADLEPLLATSTRYPTPSWPLASTLVNGAPEPVQLNQGAARPIW